MSSQPRQETNYVQVCDLCGEKVDVRNHKDWATMNVGSLADRPDARKHRFILLRRLPFGDRYSGAEKGDYTKFEWDFHVECLVKALRPLVKTKDPWTR